MRKQKNSLIINYKKFISENFSVLDSRQQIPVPFVFNPVQEKYHNILTSANPEMDGVREIILKSRQEGFSSYILALFAVDFLLRPYSVSICISHRKDSTDLLFKKVKFYIDGYLQKLADKNGVSLESISKQFFKSDNRNLLENAQNNAIFYIGTAGAKVGGRGNSARNLHFSEAAFYQDTDMVTAEEMIIATAQQVPQGKGMIFIESTANGVGNFYQQLWEQALQNKVIYKPEFFGWQEFYTEEWIAEKRKEFPNERMFLQEYPGNPDEAFVSSGTPFFDNMILKEMDKLCIEPIMKGRFAADGNLDEVYGDVEVQTKIYREPDMGEQFVVFADPADTNDFCAAIAFSKKHYDCPIVFNAVMESSQFGYELNALCKYIFNKTGMWPKLAVERNTGQATIFVLKNLNYPDLFRMVDFSSSTSAEKGNIGWQTTGNLTGGELQGTRRKMLDDLALAIKQGIIKIPDKTTIQQMMSFLIIKGKAQAKSNKKDDLVMSLAGVYQIHQLTPSVDWGDYDEEGLAREREKWRFK